MILACDIGNTNITAGIFRGKRLVHKIKFPTSKVGNGFPAVAGSRLLWEKPFPRGIAFSQIEAVIICSVVPRALKSLKASLKTLPNIPVYILGENIIVPIKNLYAQPKQVGQDRLVNAYAGIILYGAPLLVVDFGTAITFDIISSKKEYLGGMILPGLEISLQGLAEYTALLPKISLERPRGFIGRNTKQSMLSGIIYGFAAATDELSRKIKREIGKQTKVIATGGNINLIGKYCHGLDGIDSDLTLRGLNFIYQQQRQSKSNR